MKITINERVKHRLIGLAVILSLVAIFAPAIMKKSLRNFDDNLNISVELPSKPASPKIAMLKEEALFKTVKAAHVEIPPLPKIKSESTLAKAELINPADNVVTLPSIPVIAKAESVAQNPVNAAPELKKKHIGQPQELESSPQALNEPTPHPLSIKLAKNNYAVQLGTFSKLSNATALVKKLHKKGYRAIHSKVIIQNKIYYKVLVGQPMVKEQAKILQKQLADAVRIDGILVNPKVS
jgi:DedD protein